MINHEIGASGKINEECKTIVSQYGEKIIDHLRVKVTLIAELELLSRNMKTKFIFGAGDLCIIYLFIISFMN